MTDSGVFTFSPRLSITSHLYIKRYFYPVAFYVVWGIIKRHRPGWRGRFPVLHNELFGLVANTSFEKLPPAISYGL